MEYKVERDHLGDKPYVKGEMRHGEPSDVAHLLRMGVLIEVKVDNPPEVKADAPQASGEGDPAPAESAGDAPQASGEGNPTPAESAGDAPAVLAKASVKK